MSPDQHRAIASRLSTFSRAITGSTNDRPAVGVEIAKLLAAFPTQDPGMSASLRIEAYSDALDDLPAFAVREARLRIVRGEAPGLDARFAPTPPQLAALVRDVLKPLRDDLADLVALSHVEPVAVISDQEREEVGRGLGALVEELRGNMEATRAESKARRLEAIEATTDRQLARMGVEPGGVSPALLETLKPRDRAPQ